MRREHSLEPVIHYTMSVIGGFITTYGLLMRSDFFGAAQTSNLIYLVKDFLGHNPGDIIIRLGALALYILAIGLTVYLPHRFSVNLKAISIWIDIAAVFFMGFLPAQMDPVLGLYPMFFAMAFQWCSFRGYGDYTSSSTFSTNNIRQCVSAIVNYRMKRDRAQRKKAGFYGLTLCSFYIGVLLSFLLCPGLGVRGIWLAWIPLAGALVLTYVEQHSNLPLHRFHPALVEKK